MPRASPYEISLSSTEEHELKKKRSEVYVAMFSVVRAKMVLLLAPGPPQR